MSSTSSRRSPSRLADLTELATNIHWTWDRETQALFERLDPAAWRRHRARPAAPDRGDHRRALGAARRRPVRSSRPTRAAADRLHDAIDVAALVPGPAGRRRSASSPTSRPSSASARRCRSTRGGLGILAGDHLKAASDLGVPLVGIGLLYAEGYFRQRLNADGYQEERFPRLDPTGLALHPTDVVVEVDVAGDLVKVRVWQAQIGRIPLYLLDTAVDGNSAEGYAITDRLYGGDVEHRIRQEIVLGIGGVRVLRAPRPRPAGVPQQRGPRRVPRWSASASWSARG